MAHAEDQSNVNTHWPSLKEYTAAHSALGNDCYWLHEFLSSDAISAGRISPKYLVRVCYKETEAASRTLTKEFGTGSFALLDLRKTLGEKHVLAVILCHRDSSQVDPAVLDLLWSELKLEVSFMRHHFDYKEFREEQGCPKVIRDHLGREEGLIEVEWTFGGRWNPIRLPSETRSSILRLNVDSECFSVCYRGGIVIALIRSKAVYQEPLSPWKNHAPFGRERRSYSCAVDLFAATADMSSLGHELPNDPSEILCCIVHFYARLLVLRCYEDFSLRHDPQPVELDESDRIEPDDYLHQLGMHHRRLELVKLNQDLFAYLRPLAAGHESIVVSKDSDLADDPYRRKLRSLLTDVEMLLSLYDNTMKIYEWHVHITGSDYKGALASEQLEEARESKATAISLGKLSNMAFLYLPVNFVCAMLGMNLSIFGQGEVPVWVFLILVVFFSLLTYLPIYLSTMDERTVRLFKLTYYLAWRSIPAGFWYLAFSLTHSYHQNTEITYSGLAQVILGWTGFRTKGWMDGKNDDLFESASLGSKAFWKEKVKVIFGAVEELRFSNESTELTV